MAREKLALILMASMLALSAWNIRTVSLLSHKIAGQLEQAESSALTGDWDNSAEYFEAALELWLNAEQYSHIFIRHPEIDSCTDLFFELEQAILAENKDGIAAVFSKLHSHVRGIADMEKLKLGNIL